MRSSPTIYRLYERVIHFTSVAAYSFMKVLGIVNGSKALLTLEYIVGLLCLVVPTNGLYGRRVQRAYLRLQKNMRRSRVHGCQG